MFSPQRRSSRAEPIPEGRQGGNVVMKVAVTCRGSKAVTREGARGLGEGNRGLPAWAVITKMDITHRPSGCLITIQTPEDSRNMRSDGPICIRPIFQWNNVDRLSRCRDGFHQILVRSDEIEGRPVATTDLAHSSCVTALLSCGKLSHDCLRRALRSRDRSLLHNITPLDRSKRTGVAENPTFLNPIAAGPL